MDFGLECQRDVRRLFLNFTHRTGFRMFELFRDEIRKLHILKYATQVSCNFQHGRCTFVTILFGHLARLFFNLSMRIRALSPKSASILGLVEQAFWRMSFFPEWSCASSFEVILAQHRIFPHWLLPLGLLVSRCNSAAKKILEEGFGCVGFCTLIRTVSETAIVSFWTLPVSFHWQQSPRFVHVVLFPDS